MMIKFIIDVVLFSSMFTFVTGIVLAAAHVLGWLEGSRTKAEVFLVTTWGWPNYYRRALHGPDAIPVAQCSAGSRKH
jgi:hypothetical protein